MEAKPLKEIVVKASGKLTGTIPEFSAERLPEQINAEVQSLKKAAGTMFAEFKTLKQHYMSRVEEVMNDCNMSEFIPWKWEEYTKDMTEKERIQLLNKLRTHGYEFTSEKYPKLEFIIAPEYPNIGQSHSKIKNYIDEKFENLESEISFL